MKKKLLVILIATLALVVTQTYADMEKQLKEARDEKQKTLLELFDKKCTKCHDAPDASKIHKNYNKPIDAVRTMQKKKGSEITELEAIDIAEFLEGPQLALMQIECTKCHNLDRVIRACGDSTLNKDTIKRMQQKGARLNDEQVDILFSELKKKQKYEKMFTLLALFGNKCTKCHVASRAKKIHETEQKPLDVVKKMQEKDGAGISNQEATDITKFFEEPYWQLPMFNDKCTKCHSLDRIIDTCNNGPMSINISKETIKKMQKKGAEITDEQLDMMYEILNN
jgi:ribosomal protein S16